MKPGPQRQRAYWIALVLPLALYLLAFLVIPFINIIILSFYTHSPTRIWTPDLTTANYSDLVDASFLAVLLRTLRLGLVCTVICVLFGYPLAWISTAWDSPDICRPARIAAHASGLPVAIR